MNFCFSSYRCFIINKINFNKLFIQNMYEYMQKRQEYHQIFKKVIKVKNKLC